MSARQTLITHLVLAVAVIAAALVLAVYRIIDAAAAVALIAAVAGPVLGSTITLAGAASQKPTSTSPAAVSAPQAHVTVVSPPVTAESKES